MPPVKEKKEPAVLLLGNKEGAAASPRKNKNKRLRQRLRLVPVPATAEAEGRVITAVDVLLAEFAKQEVLKQIKGDNHAP